MVSDLQVFCEVNQGELDDALTAGFFDTTDLTTATDLINFAAQSKAPECLKTPEARHFILDVFLHCADISNPIKPFEMCKKWAWRVIDEFFAQGDQEKQLKLDISPMCNRDSTNKPVMQFNFIDFVVAPIYFRFLEIFPPLEQCGVNLLLNQQHWLEMRVDEIENGDKTGKP